MEAKKERDEMTLDEIMALQPGPELDSLVSDALGDSFIHPSEGKLFRNFTVSLHAGWMSPVHLSTDLAYVGMLLKRIEAIVVLPSSPLIALSLELHRGGWDILVPLEGISFLPQSFRSLPELLCKTILALHKEEAKPCCREG